MLCHHEINYYEQERIKNLSPPVHILHRSLYVRLTPIPHIVYF